MTIESFVNAFSSLTKKYSQICVKVYKLLQSSFFRFQSPRLLNRWIFLFMLFTTHSRPNHSILSPPREIRGFNVFNAPGAPQNRNITFTFHWILLFCIQPWNDHSVTEIFTGNFSKKFCGCNRVRSIQHTRFVTGSERLVNDKHT